MIFITGGRAQGKLEYALKKYGVSADAVKDAGDFAAAGIDCSNGLVCISSDISREGDGKNSDTTDSKRMSADTGGAAGEIGENCEKSGSGESCGCEAVNKDRAKIRGREDILIVNNIHEFIRNYSNGRNDASQIAAEVFEIFKNADIVICDEVGCGIVPVERSERLYRDAVGRTACLLAEKAEAVVRLQCGIPAMIK